MAVATPSAASRTMLPRYEHVNLPGSLLAGRYRCWDILNTMARVDPVMVASAEMIDRKVRELVRQEGH